MSLPGTAIPFLDVTSPQSINFPVDRSDGQPIAIPVDPVQHPPFEPFGPDAQPSDFNLPLLANTRAWSIVGIETHGAWEDSTAFPLGLPDSGEVLVQSSIQSGLIQQIVRDDTVPSDVVVRHLPDQIHSVLYDSVPSEDRAEAVHLVLGGRDQYPLVRVTFDVPRQAIDAHENAQIELFGNTGEVYGQIPMPRPGSGFSLLIRANSDVTAVLPGLILGITRTTGSSDTPTPATSPPISFAISVDRGDNASNAATDGGTITRPEFDLSAFGPSRWMTTPRVDTLTDGLVLDAAGQTEATIGLGQTTDSNFPLRGAGPAGGVVADGESAPEVNPLDGAIIDLTLMELSPEVAPNESENEYAPLTNLTSASGFPMLATSALIPRIENEDEQIASVHSERLPVRTAIDHEEDAEAKAPPTKMALGVGIAAGVTFGVLLPDAIARLAPRAAGKPRPRWSRRLFWRKLTGPK